MGVQSDPLFSVSLLRLLYIVRRLTISEKMVSKRRDLEVEKNGKHIVGPVRPTKVVQGLRGGP